MMDPACTAPKEGAESGEAVRRAAEQARDEDRVGRRDSTSNRRGRKGEMGKKKKRDTEKTMQRGHFAPRTALAGQHNNSSLSSKDLSSMH